MSDNNSFTGLTSPSKTKALTGFYQGAPCIHSRHSGENGTAHAWRKKSDHACMECIEEIEAGHFSLDLMLLEPEARKRALRFWYKVEINDWDDCWQWKGDVNSQRRLYYYWHRPDLYKLYTHHPLYVLNWITRGDIGRHGITSLCGERRCCNPLHQVPTGIEIPTYDSDYLEQQRSLLITQISELSRPQMTPKVATPVSFEATEVGLAYQEYLRREFKKMSDKGKIKTDEERMLQCTNTTKLY